MPVTGRVALRPNRSLRAERAVSLACAFDAAIGAGERLICRDGQKWRIETLKDGKTVKEGELATPLPTLDDTTDFEFSADLKDGTPCVVDILKEYAR